MASPRTMWTGPITLGLLNIPVTIGKATDDGREHGVKEVCVHGDEAVKISRSEYCPQCKGRPATKREAVEREDGTLHILSEDEREAIGNVGHSLTVVDVQPLSKLPMLYAQGAYYVRHDGNSKQTADALATLVATLMVERVAIVCKWGSKLCALSAEQGILFLRRLPYLEDVRKAGEKERSHMKVKVDPKAVGKLGELLTELRNPEGFDYAALRDENLAAKRAVVDKILKGEKPKRKAPPKSAPQTDIFDMIDAAVAEVKKDKVNS